MKIGIDARFLTHPQEGGFKTYTQNLVYGLSLLDDRNDYTLYTDRPGDEEVYSHGRMRVKPVIGPAPIREQVLLPVAMAKDHIDIAHFPCNTAPVMHFCRMALTIHDLIPCQRRQTGSRKSRALAAYWRTVMPRAAQAADKIITISESSKSDICNLLKAPENKIAVVPTGLHPDFMPVDDPEEAKLVQGRLNLPGRFILGFASSDPRKNCEGLLRAAGLAADRLGEMEIVLVCSSPEARDMALDVARLMAGPSLKMTLLDPVTRRDLVVIYNLAEALVFPSFYEGFGLPVIEAMACGTPVVTSNVSSLPEVAGDAALLTDPNDPESIAEAMVRIVKDEALKTELIRRGAARASEYNWSRTAMETIAVYESLADSIQARNGRIAGGASL
jgi:glycosyltransferase involved in cell wall biosynthesis